MDLKQNITKTDTLKNDLKLAKQKINDKILSGGGTIADTLTAVPERIDKMLKENYKKVSVLKPNKEFKNNTISGIKTFTVDLTGLNFIPKSGFLKFKYKITREANYFPSQHTIDINAKSQFYANYMYNWDYKITVYNITIKDNKLNFNVSISFAQGSSLAETVDIKLEEIVLIE